MAFCVWVPPPDRVCTLVPTRLLPPHSPVEFSVLLTCRWYGLAWNVFLCGAEGSLSLVVVWRQTLAKQIVWSSAQSLSPPRILHTFWNA